MGEFSILRLNQFELEIEKNHLLRNHSCLFKHDEFRELIEFHSDEVDNKKVFWSYFFDVIQRLDLLGYSLEQCMEKYNEYSNEFTGDNFNITFKDIFENSRLIDINNDMMEYDSDDLQPYQCSDFSRQYIKIINCLNSEKNIIESGYEISEFLDGIDPYIILRILANNEKNLDGKVIWDYMDLVFSGYIRGDVYEKDHHGRFLIVTEGSSDIDILKKAFNKLNQNISHFFEFIDMDKNYPFTGSGNLVNFYNGLCKINPQRRVIFIFDNDTEGVYSFKKCQESSQYIKTMLLPSLDEFNDILCLGPDGAYRGNINNKAVSIEMFLDLKYKNNGEPKIRWKNYKDLSESYQGSLIGKEKYISFFHGGICDEKYNFEKLNMLLNNIIETAKSFRLICKS
jgi:hypothetical protein